MAHPTIPLEEVVSLLAEVFRKEGYEAASLATLAGATGLGKSSLYHFFPGGKEEMANAVLTKSNQTFMETVVAPLKLPKPPATRIAEMVRNVDHYYCSGEASCLLGMFSMGSAPSKFRAHIENGFAAWLEALTKVLVEYGFTRSVARQRAEDTIFRIEGALLVSRGMSDPAPFRRLLIRLKSQIISD